MAKKLPLVLVDGQVEQLNANDDLPIPTEVEECKLMIAKLTAILLDNGIEVDDEQLIDNLDIL